ncbi:MAG: RagB/SusD family nutrient uptake outer membrane protein [Gemmatimonadota bacterium]
MKKPMNRIYAAVVLGVLTLSASCKDFLDVNTNPNAPEIVSPNLYLAPMLHWLVTGPQFDGRFIGRYTQQWTLPGASLSTWDRMGYDPSSDNGGQMWRDVYWSFGQNLVDMNTRAEAEQRWDLLGVGVVLKAWGWQELTDAHGEIIVKEAIDQSKFAFNYDTQEYAYQEVKRLLDSAIVLLKRTDGAVDQAYLARGDKIYNGDRAKWLKLAYGMLAIHLNHYSNKAALYKPTDVIAAVDQSFSSNADDALLGYTAIGNDDTNFWGRTRGNIASYRQTRFVVNLMNGSQFGGVVDPRMARMLSPSPDGQYRGLDINVVGFGALTAAQQPNNFHGYSGTGGVASPGRYIFDDKAKIPLITYAQLQFVKAEAALRMGNQATAAAAYRAGISAHIDFVNTYSNTLATPITGAEKDAFLTAIVPASLTLSHIMPQKYIAQWGWGHNEVWLDMRRYHYTDIDPVSGTQVYRGFAPPTTFHPDNGGKVVQRIRPRFNSEYVWNVPALSVIGGLALDYHTKPMWITEP